MVAQRRLGCLVNRGYQDGEGNSGFKDLVERLYPPVVWKMNVTKMGVTMVNSVPGPRILRPNDAVLFLDFDGVLHPDAAFRTKRGIQLRAPGELMMHAKTLEIVLQDFPTVRICLSTSWVRLLGYQRARIALPPSLQERTVSATWHSRMRGVAGEGYDIFTRYEQICGAVTRARFKRWVAVDDDPDLSWPIHDSRLVRCDPQEGLGRLSTQDELRWKLTKLFD